MHHDELEARADHHLQDRRQSIHGCIIRVVLGLLVIAIVNSAGFDFGLLRKACGSYEGTRAIVCGESPRAYSAKDRWSGQRCADPIRRQPDALTFQAVGGSNRQIQVLDFPINMDRRVDDDRRGQRNVQTGRRGYGIEIDPLLCDVIIRRLHAICGLEAILAERSEPC